MYSCKVLLVYNVCYMLSIGYVSWVISLTSMGTASEGRGGANKSYVIIVTIRAQRNVSSMAAVGLHRKRKNNT